MALSREEALRYLHMSDGGYEIVTATAFGNYVVTHDFTGGIGGYSAAAYYDPTTNSLVIANGGTEGFLDGLAWINLLAN